MAGGILFVWAFEVASSMARVSHDAYYIQYCVGGEEVTVIIMN